MGFIFIRFMLHPDKSKPVFIIIPAYNEEKMIREVLKGLIPLGCQLIVVDDGSATPLQPLLFDLPVTVLRHAINLGQGAALQTGFYGLRLGGQHFFHAIRKLPVIYHRHFIHQALMYQVQ